MNSRKLMSQLLWATVVAMLGIGAAAVPLSTLAAPPNMPPGLEKKLLDTVEKEGQVRVIVGLQLPGRPFQFESNLPDKAAKGQQRVAIVKAQQDLQDELLPYNAKTRRTYVTIPFMSLSVNRNALEHLLNSPRVTSIEEVQVYEPTMQSTGRWIGSANTWGANFGGQGSSVAIIDTGIDQDHPFFGGGGPNGNVNRVVDQACFSTNDGNTLCPNGSDTQYGAGAADVVNVANCYAGGAVGNGAHLCDHGTHVAGTAAGQDDGTRNYNGVAPMAGIVAIQAAHRVADCDDDTAGNQPCVRFFSDDTIAGLDWVRVYSDTYNNVASVNMSLGGGFHYTPCNGEAEQAAVQNLKTAGIATAIAAGNDGWTWATGSPGCIPEAVTVGAVWDTDASSYMGAQQPDDVLLNMAYWVDLMAVGAGVDSSIPDNTWGNGWFGTSMATPQVTGAFAVIHSIKPANTVDDTETLLKTTGVQVQDQRTISPTLPFPTGDGITYPDPCDPPNCQPRTGQVQPRLQLDAAVAAITSADLDIFKDCKPDGTKPVGADALCHIKVTNLGEWAAMAVQVVDSYLTDGSAPFILGAIVVSPTGAANCTTTTTPSNNQKVTCDLGGMQKGEVVEITVPVQAAQPLNVNDEAVVTSITPDPNNGNNRATDGLSFGLAEADVVVTKTCKPALGEEPFHVGDETRGKELPYCEIIATNHGGSAAKGVVLKDTINGTSAFSIISVVGTGVTCVGIGGPFTTKTITCDSVASLAKDASISLKVTYNATEAVAINDTAEVTTTGSQDPNPGNNQAKGAVQILGTADLSITKAGPPDPVNAGENVTYVLTVANSGPSTAPNVVARDVLPKEVSLVSATPSQGACSGTTVPGDPAQPLTCNLGSLANAGSATIIVVAKVNPAVSKGTILVNNASVQSDFADPDNGNNNATASTTVNTSADLVITKTSDKSVYKPSSLVIYTVTVVNKEPPNGGPSDARQVVVTDNLPDLKQAIYQSDNGGCAKDATIPTKLTCNVGYLPVGASRSFQIYLVVKGSRGDVANTAAVTSSDADPNTADNTDTQVVTIGR